MKFSGTQGQLFQAIQNGGQRFQCIGRSGLPKLSTLAAGMATVGAYATLSTKATEQKQKREIRKLVKREVKKAVKPRQPRGVSFDLFG